MTQDEPDYFSTIEPIVTAEVPPTREAAEIAAQAMRGQLNGTEALGATAQHFLATVPEVDTVIGVLSLTAPDPTAGWSRFGERSWIREWFRPGSPYATGPKMSEAGYAVAMPWTAQRARRTGISVINGLEDLPAVAAMDRRESAAYGLHAGVTCALIGDEAMLGSFAICSSRSVEWSPEVIADALLLRAAVTGRIGIERARAALALAVSRADRAEQGQLHLQSVLEHDLHGPLADLLATPQGLEPARVADTVRQALAVAHDVIEMRRELVRSDLDWVGVPQAVADVAHWVRHAVQEAELSLEIGDLEPTQVRTTATALRRVLVNLFGHAIYRTPPGRTIHVDLSRHGAGDGERVRIGVRDGGPPLSLEEQADLFQPAPGSPSMPGAGLGMPVSRSLVERDGGVLGFSSTEEGVTTWVELPGRAR